MSDIRDNDGLLDTILSVPITLLDARFLRTQVSRIFRTGSDNPAKINDRISCLIAGSVGVAPLNAEKKGDQYSRTYFFNAKLAE